MELVFIPEDEGNTDEWLTPAGQLLRLELDQSDEPTPEELALLESLPF
jgi:hypothetical protein